MNSLSLAFTTILVLQASIFVLFNLLMLRASKKPPNILKQRYSDYRIAVIIPCYNESRVITKKIENLLFALSFNKESNIYVIDDGSSDNTVDLVENYKQQHKLTNLTIYKNPQNIGKTASLNWIFKRLTEDIIVITDADAMLEENAISALVENFADPRVGAVTGRLVVADRGKFSGKEEGLYRRVVEVWRVGESNLDSCSVFNGPLMAFRGSLLGKFEIDKRFNADDTQLAYEIRRLGYRCVYEPSAIASEYISDSLKVRVKQEIRRARGLTKTTIKHIHVLGRFGAFGRVIYPFSLFNYVISPILTIALIILLPLLMIEYPVLAVGFLLLFIPPVRIALFGYLYRQIALVVGLISRAKVRWKPMRQTNS